VRPLRALVWQPTQLLAGGNVRALFALGEITAAHAPACAPAEAAPELAGKTQLALRLRELGWDHIQHHSESTVDSLQSALRSSLEAGRDVVVDALNLTKADREQWWTVAAQAVPKGPDGADGFLQFVVISAVEPVGQDVRPLARPAPPAGARAAADPRARRRRASTRSTWRTGSSTCRRRSRRRWPLRTRCSTSMA